VHRLAWLAHRGRSPPTCASAMLATIASASSLRISSLARRSRTRLTCSGRGEAASSAASDWTKTR
jgi:hypothetical protein